MHYVDEKTGSDLSGDGSEATPYATIQRAVDKAADGDTIRVQPGVYSNGCTQVVDSLTSATPGVAGLARVFVFGKALTIESVKGKDVTHIVGAPASAPDAYGRGTDAVRCIAHYGKQALTVRGFTIRNGCT